MPPQSAANTWVRFVNNAKACINHYNKKYQVASWVRLLVEAGLKKSPHLPTRQSTRKIDPLLLGEQDGSYYYHINFHAQDKKGHAQLFFGEIRVCVAPEEEDATCCSPVSPSDAGGKRLQTVEEAMKYKFPTWGTAGMDEECCYGCYPAMKHPKGTCYVAGHVADPRQYFVPDK
ncbi:hypothetical protein GQ55_1G040600 [Panicum hallii var. hallii]|nr:hypothetical protein GQ55_1G040600 [Panicum hallii var. hallii]